MLVIIENESEIAAGTRGSSLGIGALKVVSQTKQDGFFGKFQNIYIDTENDLLNHPTQFTYAKRIDGLVKVYNKTCSVIEDVLKNNHFPLVLSGDHACAGGTIAGIKKAYPDKKIGVIWIDAHADIHTPYTTPSGNLHGMPLATAFGTDNLDCQVNNPIPETVSYWNELKNIGGIQPKVNPENVVFISVRDTEEPEDKFIEKHQIKNYSVEEIRKRGLEKVKTEIQLRLTDCDIIYISFDVDSMDSILVSKGTGTPVENGLSPEEAEFFMIEFAKWQKVVCMEFVEINPCLDNKINKMAETAYEILLKTGNALENRLK